MEKEHRYQIVLDDGQFFYVVAIDRTSAFAEAVFLVDNCEVHDRGEV